MRNKIIISIFVAFIFIMYGCATVKTIFKKPVPIESISTLVTSDPSGAIIYWGADPNNLFETDNTTPYLEHNKQESPMWISYYYQVRKEGYKDSGVLFQLEAAGDRLVHFNLQPLDFEIPMNSEKADYKYGAYTVVSEPAGAHVVIKETGEYIGRTPTEVRLVQRDKNRESTIVSQQIILNKRDFQLTELTLNLICDNETELDAANSPMAIFAMLTAVEKDPAFSTVKITSEPSGASVYHSGYLLGQTPLEYDFYWKSPSLSHELTLEMSGFDSKSAILKINNNGVNVVLQPSITIPE